MASPQTRRLALCAVLVTAAGACADAANDHWAWRPPHRPAVPEIRDPKFAIRNPIDGLIAAKLQAANLARAPAADRRTLIRRVTFDLIGLPPTPEEVEAFVADEAPDAWEK